MGTRKDRARGSIAEDRIRRSTLHFVLLRIRRGGAEQHLWESSGLRQQEAPGSCGGFEEGKVALNVILQVFGGTEMLTPDVLP